MYEPLRGTPKYYGIVSVTRNKITVVMQNDFLIFISKFDFIFSGFISELNEMQYFLKNENYTCFI